MSIVRRAIDEFHEGGIAGFSAASFNYLRRKATQPPPQYRLPNALWSLTRPRTCNFLDEEWDTLLILDACRYDVFSEENRIDGRLESRYSIASNTATWLRRTFLGAELYDTVYVTSNPNGLKLENGVWADRPIFFKTVSALDLWDAEHQTVLPEDVARRTLDAHEEHPDKRIISHFVQPHAPYLGEKAREIHERIDDTVAGWNLDRDFLDYDFEDVDTVLLDVFDRNEYDLDESDLREAYRETLAIALESVESLVDELDGRTVITADHGEMLGEKAVPFGREVFGHPGWLKTDELRRVPWLVRGDGPRRPVTPEEPVETAVEDDDVIAERLRALGYTDRQPSG